MSSPRGERGSATIWLLACCTVMVLVAGAASLRGVAVLARHRAEAGADLAALAAAGRIGTGAPPCASAAAIARDDGVRLLSCRLRLDPAGRSGTVTVRVELLLRLPLAGVEAVTASARAGRLGALWHAGRGRPPGAGTAETRGDTEGARMEISVSRTKSGNVPIVAVSGEVDVYSAPTLKDSVTELLESGASTLIVDLSGVAFLDSTGLGALVEARAATSEAGGSLPLVCNQERILKLFTITGLDSVFTIHPNMGDAIAAL